LVRIFSPTQSDKNGSDLYLYFCLRRSSIVPSVPPATINPFDLKRGELVIYKIFVHNPTVDDATVRIFFGWLMSNRLIVIPIRDKNLINFL
jgi:hypothetical protein